MILDKPTIFPLVLLAIVFISLGFIQIVFQQDIQQAVEETRQTQRIMNHTLATLINATPQSNFTAQAQAIANIEQLIGNVKEIKQMLNEILDKNNQTSAGS